LHPWADHSQIVFEPGNNKCIILLNLLSINLNDNNKVNNYSKPGIRYRVADHYTNGHVPQDYNTEISRQSCEFKP
jgi:hypothetical protein